MISDILFNLNILFMNLISQKKLNLADLFIYSGHDHSSLQARA